MFRTLIYPSSGACDYSVELPRWSYCSWFDVCWCFGVVGLEWYPCCRLKLFSDINPLNAELNPICHLLVLLGAHHILHVSRIRVNISFIRILRLLCWITTFVILFLVRCVLEFRCGWVGVVSVFEAEACNTDTTPTQPYRNSNTHRTKNNTTNVVIQQSSRKLLMMDILMSETCWAHKKWNKIASYIKLVFYSSTVTVTFELHSCCCSYFYLIHIWRCFNFMFVFVGVEISRMLETFAETSRTAFVLRCFVIHLTYCKCICWYNNNNKFHAPLWSL